MSGLLYKEFKLAQHETIFFFPLFGLMLLIPSYPYTVAFIYTSLEIFFIFLSGRENKDVLFTALLPVAKRDVVRARTLMIVILQLINLAVSVPFAFIGRDTNPQPGGNGAGIEANAAYYGIVLVSFAIFNYLFLTKFYKTGYSAGAAFAWSGAAFAVWLLAAEISVQVIPALKSALDGWELSTRPLRLCALAAGAVIYATGTLLGSARAQREFEKADL